jgi:hypothetical protein
MAPILKLMSRVFVVAAFAALPAAPALAGACASGDVCNIELTNPNIYVTVPGDVTIDVRVTIDNSDGLNTKLIVSLISTSLTNTYQGIKDFGYNSDVTATAPGWALKGGKSPFTMDGFGDFISEYTTAGSGDPTVTFTLASLVTLFTDNANGGEFAAHLTFVGNTADSSCSLFVSDGTHNGGGPDTQETGCTTNRHEGPEPGSLLLLGIGIAALGLARRRMSART